MKSHRIGLALAGGGFLGAAYELGALAALAESIDGLELNRLDAYVGVSAGSFVAAGLANGLSPYEMVRMFSVTRRRELCEHAYQQTRADLRLRAQFLSKTLARHNLQMNHAVLAERSLTLFGDGARTEPAMPQSLDATATRLRYALDDLDRTKFLSQLGALNHG